MTGLRINTIPQDYPFDISGMRFGKLRVRHENFVDPMYKTIMYFCECECGVEKYLNINWIKRRGSCGCSRYRHPFGYRIFGKHPWYGSLSRTLSGMIQRCENPSSPAYLSYGAKGITVCEEWKWDRDLFIGWALQNGYQPGLTIDRIDNYQGYFESNCRWVTLEENGKNKRCHQDARAKQMFDDGAGI
jgi:hypothetical protein